MPDRLNKYHTAEHFRGAGYPIGRTKPAPVVIEEELLEIRSSVIQILNTSLRERVMYPEFGSRLREILWNPLDDFIISDIRYEVRTALRLWEPRIHVLNIEFDLNDYLRNRNILALSLEYVLLSNPSTTRLMEVPVASPTVTIPAGGQR